MGQFGTGCCTGGYRFGGNTGGGAGWTPPPEENLFEGCAPWSIPSDTGLPTRAPQGKGKPPGNWPEWMKKRGCGTISILKLNEFPGGPPILTPGNATYMADCVRDCLGVAGPGGYTTGGLTDGLGPEELECFLKCKKQLMSHEYDKEIDPSAFRFPRDSSTGEGGPPSPGIPKIPEESSAIVILSGDLSTICPPLCKEGTITIGFLDTMQCFDWYGPGITRGQGRLGRNLWKDGGLQWASPKMRNFAHATTCKVIGCNIGDGSALCLECEDHEPQNPQKYTMCVDAFGVITSISEVTLATSPRDTVGGPGSCAKKFQNKKYQDEHGRRATGGPPDHWGRPRSKRTGPPCCEHNYGPGDKGGVLGSGRYYPAHLNLIIIDVPCPPEGDK